MPLVPSRPRLGDLDWPDVTIPVEPRLRSHPGDRSPGLLRDIAAQFSVATNPRYVPRDTSGDGKRDTHCDAYVTDCAAALGCVLPWTWRGRELSANGICDWLAGDGIGYGWGSVSAHQAEACAAAGFPVIATWRNPAGSGHVAVVLPPAEAGGLRIAQAGGRCFFDEPIGNGFGAHAVTFYAHP